MNASDINRAQVALIEADPPKGFDTTSPWTTHHCRNYPKQAASTINKLLQDRAAASEAGAVLRDFLGALDLAHALDRTETAWSLKPRGSDQERRHAWAEVNRLRALLDAAPAAESINRWLHAEKLADVPAVDEALRTFCEDASGDNGIGVIVAVLDAIAAPAAESEETTTPRQYFYRVNECTTKDAKNPDCICWHNIGQGPLKGREATATDWRDKPTAATADAQDNRYPPTNRRESAVATLLGMGWKWDGNSWNPTDAQGDEPKNYRDADDFHNNASLAELDAWQRGWDDACEHHDVYPEDTATADAQGDELCRHCNLPVDPPGYCACNGARYEREHTAQGDELVTSILLDVGPGWDGMGHEIYAKSVDDVVKKLTAMGERIEELESERDRLCAALSREPAAAASAELHEKSERGDERAVARGRNIHYEGRFDDESEDMHESRKLWAADLKAALSRQPSAGDAEADVRRAMAFARDGFVSMRATGQPCSVDYIGHALRLLDAALATDAARVQRADAKRPNNGAL